MRVSAIVIHFVAVIAVLAAIQDVLAGQSELVIAKEGTEYYHRPGCPVIRDGKGVIAMALGQAQLRGYKQHPACDPATSPPASDTSRPADKPKVAAPVFVYVDDSKYYHRQDCRNLAKSSRKVALEEAGKRLWPCPVCRPPVRKKSDEPAVHIRRR
jgi:hypothetical protein